MSKNTGDEARALRLRAEVRGGHGHRRALILTGALVLGGCGGGSAPVDGSAGAAPACLLGATPGCVAPGVPAVAAPGAPSTPRPTPSTEVVMPGSFSGNPGTNAASGGDGGLPPNLDGGARDAAVPGGDRCDVGVLDEREPPRPLALRGNLGAHDPVIIAAEGLYRYFSTGNGISVKTSPDLLEWTQQADVFAATPAWFQQRVPAYAPRNIWAPDISYFGGLYHLYYSVSSFGSNRSCIGHATRPALEAGAWLDREDVFCSGQPGQNGDYNAIDPNVILDEAGTPWMAFGSFWSGVKMIRLRADGARAGAELIDLASRGGGAIEAPFIVRRCGYYYLFVSFDACCQGADSTYNTRVGRSPELLGPYVDRDGTPMMNGGGTLLLGAAGEWVGPGHNAILIDGTRAYNVYHAYAAANGASELRISELVWDGEGWPISGGP